MPGFNKLNSSLQDQPTFEYDETGKITGYKTKVGADTVFPFNKSLKLMLKKTVGMSGRGSQYAYFKNYFVDDSGTESLIFSCTVDNYTAGHDNTNCGLVTYVTRNASTGYHTIKNNLTVPLIRSDGVTIPARGTFTDMHDGSTFTLST